MRTLNRFILIAFVISVYFIEDGLSESNGAYYIHGRMGSRSEVKDQLAYDIIQDAFEVWTCYTKITFRRVMDPKEAQIFVVLGSGPHVAFRKDGTETQCPMNEFSNDLNSNFGATAHSSLLDDPIIPGNIHLHADQLWTYGTASYGGRPLLEVMVHEIGHLFGISHNQVKNNPEAVMVTGQRKYIPPDKFDLTRDDLIALTRTRFGKLLLQKRMIRYNCRSKPWQTRMQERKSRTERCRDIGSGNCRRGVSVGYCELEFETTRFNCRETCGFCECKDVARDCQVDRCVQLNYYKSYLALCRKTCGLCPNLILPWVKFKDTPFAKKRCVDEISPRICEKSRENCKTYTMMPQMMRFCRRTCKFCQ